MKKILTDADANKVYFSKIITYYNFWIDIMYGLDKYKINWGLIENTKDLWVRDFMPVQCHIDKMVQFVYSPSYLENKQEYRSEPQECIKGLDYNIISCNLKLDGGNVIKCDDCVIISERIFSENDSLSKNKIIGIIEKALESEIFIIPDDKYEMCGHADGMVRYLGNNKILLNHYVDFDKYLRKRLLDKLSKRFDIEELHFETKELLSTSWAYLNYMQIGEEIFIPALKNRLDDIAIKQIEDATGKRVTPIYCKYTVNIGGGLNCMSWTVKDNNK